MKDPIEKTIKYMMKQERLLVSRFGDYYYLADGFVCLKMLPELYEKTVAGISGLFKPLAEGEGWQIKPKNYEVNRSAEAFNPTSLFDTADCEYVRKTQLSASYQQQGRKKPAVVDLYAGPDYVKVINRDLDDLFTDFSVSSYMSKSKYAPLLSIQAWPADFLIMPIKMTMASQAFQDLAELADLAVRGEA